LTRRIFRRAWKAAERAVPGRPPCPLQRGEGVRPLFIVGSGRSGTTLLRRLVMAGGEIQIAPELQGAVPFLADVERAPRASWQFVCWNAWYRFSSRPEWPAFELSRTEVLERLHAIEPSQRSAAAVVDTVHRLYGARHGGEKRWGDKTPRHSEFLPLVDRAFPDAAYLHALRDGVDVVHSLLRTGMAGSAREAGELWMRRTTAVGDFAATHPGRVREVRYEDLVADPGAYMAEVCAFAGLDWEPAWAERLDHVGDMGDVAARPWHEAVAKPVSQKAAGRGRAALDLTTRRALALMNPTLERFGYDPV